MLQLAFIVNTWVIGNSMSHSIDIILNLYCNFIIICINLLNMLIKHEFKLEMFVAVCWRYGRWCISIVSSTVLLVDHPVIKVWILVRPYKLTPSLQKFFSGLKSWHTCCNLWYLTNIVYHTTLYSTMVSKQNKQAIVWEFDFHWAFYTLSLLLN